MKRKLTAFQIDPSQTAMIRRQFVADVNRRFDSLRADVFKHITDGDPYSLDDNRDALPVTRRLIGNATFQFSSNPKKLKAFRSWLTQRVNQGVLEIAYDTGDPLNKKPWVYKYINSAYRKGVVRAYTQAQPPPAMKAHLPFYQGSREQFLKSSFAQPERREKLEMIYTRAYENLKGITSTMSAQMSSIMADGLSHGKGALSVARDLSKNITGINRTRARTLARTEVIHAHAEGQLDALTELGVEKIGVEVEFSTSHDSGVCPQCKKLEGKIFSPAKSHGIIPVHPNCRCTWLPILTNKKK